MKPKRFIVLDRDGTIIVMYPYLSEPDKVELIPGAAQALRELRELGFSLVVVTNQSVIGRGYLNYEDLHHIHERLVFLLQAEGAYLDGIYFCPHTPEDDCLCRKPKTGLLELASQELGFEYKSCIVISDNKCDIELGRNVKALTILVRTGEGSLVTKDRSVPPDYIVYDIREAVWTIRDMLAKEQLPS